MPARGIVGSGRSPNIVVTERADRATSSNQHAPQPVQYGTNTCTHTPLINGAPPTPPYTQTQPELFSTPSTVPSHTPPAANVVALSPMPSPRLTPQAMTHSQRAPASSPDHDNHRRIRRRLSPSSDEDSQHYVHPPNPHYSPYSRCARTYRHRSRSARWRSPPTSGQSDSSEYSERRYRRRRRSPPLAVTAQPHVSTAGATPLALTAQPHSNMAGATPLAVTAQPHGNMAGATPLAVTAQPHVNMAGATPLAVTAQPHVNMAGATPLAVTAQPHINMAGATPLAVTAQPHVNMAGATPSVVTAQPHINMADGRGYLPSGPRATNLPPWASCQQVTATTGVGVPPLPGDTRPASGNGFQSSPSDRATIGCPVSNTPFGHGSQSMMPLIRASVTPATWQAYGKAWDEWCSLIHGRPVERCDRARCEVLVEFLNLLRQRGASGTSAQRHLSGLAFFFQLAGWADVTKDFFIRQAVKGWKRLQPSQECRRPISLSLLHGIITISPSVCTSHYESVLVSAAFAIAFFGALRISELVPRSKTSLDGGLINEDLVICNEALRIRVRKSKCDPTGRGTWVLVKSSDGPVCPLNVVKRYTGMKGAGRFFLSHADGSPLTKYQFHTIFNRCLEAVSADPSEYGTHSFRIGAATEAAKAGIPEAEVQRLGRWKSACFARYIRPDLLK
ncbi:uncharacterized protein LOC143816266 isoform X1 [Ranitomeya variabilis]|uniref:uncharacterized protein LOC143816266 isoform X1 n=1 Tax=Ranitomeya variabilis TaxID=490064 RepID=UPI00405726B7